MGRTFKSPKLDAMKYEIASSLGLTNYAQIDKGSLTSRQNGSVGGMITKTLIAQALGETMTDVSISWKGGSSTGTGTTGTGTTGTGTGTRMF
ncbi:MAG: small, acid-soluble spore protein, alpha/beta type [Methylocystaceae bacterium]